MCRGGGSVREMPRIQLSHTFGDIVSLENLLLAWNEFSKGKRNRKDVQEFGWCLMDNLICLHGDLVAKRYRHSIYEAFSISDPKPRNIHKASVRDRVLHHAVYRKLYPFFDHKFLLIHIHVVRTKVHTGHWNVSRSSVKK